MMGSLRILLPEVIFKLKPLGIKNAQVAKPGGYPTATAGLFMIIFDVVT
ncbi:hypothetical protein MKX50_24135 [Paenibacillus sp. FSL W8-0186]